MENVPSKPSAARVIFFGSGKFLVLIYAFLSQMAKLLSSMLYQAVRGKIILGWVIFPGYETLFCCKWQKYYLVCFTKL